MTNAEEQIFSERYWKAHRQNKVFHTIYAMGCGGLFLAGVLQFEKLWAMTALSAFCYPFMYSKLFSRWDAFSLLEKIRAATAKTTGSVFGVQSVLGIHQINYSYSIQGKKYKGYDLITSEQAASYKPSDPIKVSYSQSNPKISMIKMENKAAHTNPLPAPSRSMNDNYEP